MHIKAIGNVFRGGRVLEVVLPGRGANGVPWERKGLPVKPRVGGNYRDYYQDLFQRFSQNFKSTFCWLRLCSYSIQVYCITLNKWIFWIFRRNFSWKISFLNTQGNLALTKQSATFLKMLLRTVPKDFRLFSRFFKSNSTSHSAPFKIMHAFRYQMKDANIWSSSSW